MQCVSDRRKDKQRNRVEDENGAERNSHLFVVGAQDGTNGGNRAATADSCACCDEIRRIVTNSQNFADSQTDNQRKRNSYGGVHESATPCLENLVQIHAKTQGYHGNLQQESCCCPASLQKRMRKS